MGTTLWVDISSVKNRSFSPPFSLSFFLCTKKAGRGVSLSLYSFHSRKHLFSPSIPLREETLVIQTTLLTPRAISDFCPLILICESWYSFSFLFTLSAWLIASVASMRKKRARSVMPMRRASLSGCYHSLFISERKVNSSHVRFECNPFSHLLRVQVSSKSVLALSDR